MLHNKTSSKQQVPLCTTVRQLDSTSYGFVTIAPVEQGEEEAPPKIRIVENWYEEFRDRGQ
ncbi:MAG: hypothetical protein O2795_15765 [Acidobacteria bacterium]|nr:hypothetical protein [Acidobacteriota bacterium]